jgi:hypothetical protein
MNDIMKFNIVSNSLSTNITICEELNGILCFKQTLKFSYFGIKNSFYFYFNNNVFSQLFT